MDSIPELAKLSSSLSHEIRNPLSSVKIAVQTVARSPGLSARDQRRLSIAAREIRTIERMLALLAEFGRDAPPAMEAVPLEELVKEAIGLMEAEVVERQIRVRLESSAPSASAQVDVGRLRPVLAQLLLNVAMGLEDGAELPVALSALASGNAVVVDDLSARLAPDERGRLFEPFGSFWARGAGLSMAALHRLMVLHGGTVSAEERASAGVRYTLLFPA
jgi:two-component system sensor histidine kinase HydH